MRLARLSLLLSTLVCFFSHAQQKMKVYPDLNSFKSNYPYFSAEIDIIERTASGVYLSGKNDYIIRSSSRKINKVLKNYWGVESNDSLYLNCKVVLKTDGYALALFKSSKWIYFRGDAARVRGLKDYSGGGVFFAGFMFGLPGALLAAGSAGTKRFDYILDVESSEPFALNQQMLRNIIRNNSKLLQEYEADGSPETPEFYVYYLKRYHLDGK
jgi:hypothetical protein